MKWLTYYVKINFLMNQYEEDRGTSQYLQTETAVSSFLGLASAYGVAENKPSAQIWIKKRLIIQSD